MTNLTNKNALDAATLKEANNENFVPLEALNAGVTVIIPWSDLFKLGDHISMQLQSNFSSENSHLFIQSEHIGKPIEHVYPAERLAEFHGRSVTLAYLNSSLPEIDPPTSQYDFGARFYLPVVEDVREGTLPWEAVENGFSVTIPTFPEAQKTDKVRLFLVGSYPSSSIILETQIEDTSKPVIFSIDKETSRHTSGGEVYVIYQVIREDKVFTSPSLSFISEARISSPTPVHLVDTGLCNPDLMDRIENGDQTFPFTVDFGSALSEGDELFLLALNSSKIHNAITSTLIHEYTNRVELALPGPLLVYMSTFKLVALVRNGSLTHASNLRWVMVEGSRALVKPVR